MHRVSRPTRRRVYAALDARRRGAPGLSAINRLLVGLILVATLLAIVETEPVLMARFASGFHGAELLLGLVFGVEYLARLWSAPERALGEPAWRERIRFMISPAALFDLMAVAVSLAPVSFGGALVLRWVRLARILRLAKLGRMTQAWDHIAEALRSRRDELLLSIAAGLVLMVLAAVALYLAEGQVQPEKFGSIPRALWWSVATMTTIGYGDVYPITPIGKVLAALTAIFSIGLIAMPTGILAAAFSDAMARRRRSHDLDSFEQHSLERTMDAHESS